MKRLEIPKKTRIAITIIIVILILIPTIIAFAFTPIGEKTKTEEITTCSYYHNGLYYYTAYLNESKLFNNSTIQPQKDKNIYKEITEYIEMTFNYNFYSECITLIEGTYKLDIQIETENWQKRFNIEPKTRFGPNKYITQYKLNISHYEEIYDEIEEELEINSREPYLIINSSINLLLKSEEGEISDYFNPILRLPIEERVINISENLSQSKTESFEEIIEIPLSDEEIANERNTYLNISILFIIILVLFIILTKNQIFIPTKHEKQIKKILKKYKEWIIEIDELPKKTSKTNIIKTKSIEDLIKTSEELGKPVIYHHSMKEQKHYFYVLDDTTTYENIIKIKEDNIENNKKHKPKIPEDTISVITELAKHDVPDEGIQEQVEYKNNKGDIKTPSKSDIKKIKKKFLHKT
jgi:hypothetical protein